MGPFFVSNDRDLAERGLGLQMIALNAISLKDDLAGYYLLKWNSQTTTATFKMVAE